MEFKTCEKCRLCDSGNLFTALSFKEMPFLAEPVKPGDIIRSNPLTVMVCRECGYVFLREIIDSAVYDDYIYTPQASSDVVKYLQNFVKTIQTQCSIQPGMRGLEIGSGDGSLCREFNKVGIPFIGVEPSKVLCEISEKQNEVESLNTFMSRECAKQFGRIFDVVVVRHVLEHIDDFDTFFLAIDECLKEDGNLIVEVPYLGDIIRQKQFYAFFFEHLSYFSIFSLSKLIGKYGFFINYREFVYPEGGSILVHATRQKTVEPSERQDFIGASLVDLEDEFASFSQKFSDLVTKFGPIAVYGAGQRGITLLNLLGVSRADVLAIYDENPIYHGLVAPVSNIPVRHPVEMNDLPPSTKVVIMASSYDEQIRRKYKHMEGRLISLSELVSP